MAQASNLFSSPYLGWVFGRLAFYALIPISLASLLGGLLKIRFKVGLVVSLILFTIMFYILSAYPRHIYAVSLSIYATATFSYFFLIALFHRSISSKRSFAWFCLIFALNLNSHEVFLVISGFFIPLYAWYQYASIHPIRAKKWVTPFLMHIIYNKRIWILCAIYLASTLIETLAPGVTIRQHIWPSTGTVHDGIAYAILASGQLFSLLMNFPFLLVITFLAGITIKLFNQNIPLPKTKLLYLFMFCAPFIYVIVTGFLLGITPSLWMPAPLANNDAIFQLTRSVASHFATNKNMLTELVNMHHIGALAIRQTFFPMAAIFLNVFLIGFFVTGFIKKGTKNGNIISKRNSLGLTLALLPIATLLFVLHPSGEGGMRILSILLQPDTNLAMITPSKIDQIFCGNEKSSVSILHTLLQPDASLLRLIPSKITQIFHENSILYAAYPSEPSIRQMSNAIFSTASAKGLGNYHAPDIASVAIDHYLNAHRGGAVNPTNTAFPYGSPWRTSVLNLYHVSSEMGRASLAKDQKESNAVSSTSNSLGNKEFASPLKHNKMEPPVPLPLTNLTGLKILSNTTGSCMQVSDTPTKGEHFVSNNNIKLSKGLYYFTLEGKPTKTMLYLYLIGKTKSRLLAWLNGNSNNHWSQLGKGNSLKPIFSQVKILPTAEKLMVVIYSAVNQTIRSRWQHGLNNTTTYEGNKLHSSNCKAQYGRIAPS
ncbi:MAG: hypothetical protein COB66_07595 [Coxiella sp. (in: Bacteria)]|nr:MAG: hypothetical protein COB66_07595 [Coxiella sp. (in: g-proteobacteria)]